VNHDGPVLAVIGPDIRDVESLGQIVVELHGAELPFPAERILDHEVELRPIEGCLARDFVGVKLHLFSGLTNGLFCLVPVCILARVLLVVLRVAQGDLSFELVEVQRLEHLER